MINVGKAIKLSVGDVVVYWGPAIRWHDGREIQPGAEGCVREVRAPLPSTGLMISVEDDGSETIDEGSDGYAIVAFPGGATRCVYPAGLADGGYERKRPASPLTRLCACGHRLAVHGASRPHKCLNGDRNIEGADGEACVCAGYRAARKG